MRTTVMITTWALLAVVLVTMAEAQRTATAPDRGAAVPTALQDYVHAKDSSFGYEINNSQNIGGCEVLDIQLTSQTWQGIVWRHAVQAFVPSDSYPDTVLLFITGGRNGGKPGRDDVEMGVRLAQASRMACVILHQVPNQPLLGDHVEDDLITETFLKYLETKDPSWPLLFPMVKSAVKAMDMSQAIARDRYNTTVDKFVVTGGSKRGWTTWLSAVADPRVAGIAPIVIDTLNFRPQMEHQLESWGEYSEQIADYTQKGLVDVMLKQPEVPLWRWVDPYTYRDQLLLPKLVINGANDRYWVTDALNLYWNDLQGPKHVLYVPNAGHGLDDGKEQALTTLAVFAQHVALGKDLPVLDWHYDVADDAWALSVAAEPAPKSARMWVAKSDDRDFRDSRWVATEGEANGGGKFVLKVPGNGMGHQAVFGEVTFGFGPLKYNLCTTVHCD
ncbi:MAG: PhoPQ-activated protein PqaA family protein [Pirellulaceae bacterium]|nr:hypothetical protein [Planctomycetales bacterium]